MVSHLKSTELWTAECVGRTFTNPAALTEAIVEAWEASNANNEGDS